MLVAVRRSLIVPRGNRLSSSVLSTPSHHFLSSVSHPARISWFMSATIMAPHLDAAQHLLIKTLLMRGYEPNLIASEASCSVRAVQRIRLRTQQFEMFTPRANRVRHRGHITLPMRQALCDKLIEQPYLYRYEMADFLYRRFA